MDTPATVDLREVTADNWRDCAAVTPRPDQAAHVAPVTYYLCLCHYGQVWHPLAIYHHDAVVGVVMWGLDEDDNSHWIGGLVIDAAHQGQGLGRATVSTLIDRLARDQGAREVALSYHPDNAVARDLYRRLGFRETGEVADDEVVAPLTIAAKIPVQAHDRDASPPKA